METSWYRADRDTAAVATATKAAETGARNVITSIHAGYSNAAQTGTITITIGGVAVAVFDVVGQAHLLGLDIAGGVAEAVVVELSAGGGGVDGSVLLNGYTR